MPRRPRKPRNRLVRLILGEVSSVDEGDNPEAHFELIKRRIDAARRRKVMTLTERIRKLFEGGSTPLLEEIEAVIEKQEGEPMLFDDLFSTIDPMQVMDAVHRRMGALAESVFDILRSGDISETDKERLVNETVSQFAARVEGDVPKLFSGELVKALGGRGEKLTREDVMSTIDKLLPGHRSTKEVPMKIDLSGIPEEHRDAVQKAIEGSDWYKTGTASAEALKEIVDFLELEGEEDVVSLVKAKVAELQKAKPDDPDDPIAKRLAGLDADTRKFVEAELKKRDAGLADLTKTVTDLTDDIQKRKLQKVADGLTHVTVGKDVEIVDILAKAEDAGILDEITTALRSADALAAQSMKTLGSDDVGESEAHAKLEGIAEKLREADPTLTKAKAYRQAAQENPALYKEAMAGAN